MDVVRQCVQSTTSETSLAEQKKAAMQEADASEQAEKQKEAPKVQESIVRTKGVHLPRGVL